jgi:hypothetical protein
MSDLIKVLNALAAHWDDIALAGGAVLGLVALAAAVYVLKTAFAPFAAVLRWLFACRPGERPNDVVAGISLGARMLVWAAAVAAVVWFLYQWRVSS